MSLECDTPTHKGFVAYAVLCTLVYSVGTPVGFFLLTWRDRKANRQPLAILTQSYESMFYWYECAEVSSLSNAEEAVSQRCEALVSSGRLCAPRQHPAL